MCWWEIIHSMSWCQNHCNFTILFCCLCVGVCACVSVCVHILFLVLKLCNALRAPWSVCECIKVQTVISCQQKNRINAHSSSPLNSVQVKNANFLVWCWAGPSVTFEIKLTYDEYAGNASTSLWNAHTTTHWRNIENKFYFHVNILHASRTHYTWQLAKVLQPIYI